MKKVLVSLLMMFVLVPCISAEENVTPTETTEVKNQEVVQQELQEEKTEAEIELEKFIENIAPNNVLTMTISKKFASNYKYLNYNSETSYSNEDYEEIFSWFSSNYIKDFSSIENEKCYASLDEINEDLTTAMLQIYCGVNNSYESKSMEVTLKWAEEDPKGVELSKSYAEKLNNQSLQFSVSDLEMIKYLQLTKPKNQEELDNFFDYVAGKKIATSIDGLSYQANIYIAGPGDMFTFGYQYDFATGYNGIYYNRIKNVAAGAHYHIYIPTETENTPEAYVKAAQERIDNYFGENSGIKIEKYISFDEFFKNYYGQIDLDWKDVMRDITKEQVGDYTYKVIIDDKEYNFIIVKDSSKIETPTHVTEDVTVGATIETTSSEVPMDATIRVEVIEKTSEVFKNVVEKIKAKAEEVMVFDIKLFSEVKNEYITKLSNGEFIVSVPIIDTLKGKKLAAYYIYDNGKIEKHSVTVKDGIATFTTNHFSIYTIAEDNGIDVPNTYDGIMSFVVMGIIGLVGMGIFFTLKTREN